MRAETDFLLLYALLDDLTPLKADCGRVCGAACCRDCSPEGEEGGRSGMLLFPGEREALASLDGEEEGFAFLPAGEDTLLVCGGHCRRGLRPLACRLFPLFPHVDREGRVRAAYDPRAWRVCPLVREQRHVPLQRPFVRAVRRVGRLLMQDEACRDFLLRQSREMDEIDRFLRLGEERAPICRRPR